MHGFEESILSGMLVVYQNVFDRSDYAFMISVVALVWST